MSGSSGARDLLRLLRLFRPYAVWMVGGIALSAAVVLANVGLLALGGLVLVERPDSRNSSYRRKLPAKLRPLATGAITIPWKARIHEVDAPETIHLRSRSAPET